MKICKTEEEFIAYIAPIAQRVCKRYGFKPSILVAQAFHENGAAVPRNFDNQGIYKLLEYNNMVGQKSSLLNDTWSEYSVWPGVKPGKFEEYSFEKITPEEYNGKMKNIPDRFRKFDSVEQSLADYVLFLLYAKDSVSAKSYRYGPDVVNIQDPYQLIKAVGKKYATGSSYAENVYNIVKRYGLNKYDDLTNVKPTDIVPDILKESTSKKSSTKTADAETINIIKTYITTNNSNSTNDPIAIVIHNTDNFAKGATAYAHAEGLYHGYMQGMSWHYVVDDKEIYQCLPHNRGAWHVGKNFGSNNLFGTINNRNSIGIEMCVNAGYDYEKAFQNTVKLTKYLMKELNIPASKVYQHYDICTKDCPSQIRKRGDWPRFKQLIGDGNYVVDTSSTSTSKKTYLSKGDAGDSVKNMQQMLIACGYSCGSAGADGDFGNATDKAVRAFQRNAGLTVDGLYGPKSKSALEARYKTVTDTAKPEISEGAKNFLNSVKVVADMARTKGWTYGNSQATPPCSDKKISCDRLVARALYDLGYADQPKGGITCGNIGKYLLKYGFEKVTDTGKIKPGAVVAVRKKRTTAICHVFVVKNYYVKTGKCDKFDMGSDERIKKTQPYTGVDLLEWFDREFYCAWNVPDGFKAKSAEKKSADTGTVYEGVDYSPVYEYAYYRNRYPDLKKAFGTDREKYFEHFCKYGMKEGRMAISTFNVEVYRDRQPDLRKAFGNDLPAYYKHYCIFGRKEGRRAT